jgi:hypothetical protein
MWHTVFFVYNLIFLAIIGTAADKLRGVEGVDKTVYINNRALLLAVALLSVILTTIIALKFGCETRRLGVNFSYYAAVVMVAFNLFLNGIFIAIVANPQFKNCPKEVKSLFITSLVINLIGTIGGISYAVYQSKKSN